MLTFTKRGDERKREGFWLDRERRSKYEQKSLSLSLNTMKGHVRPNQNFTMANESNFTRK